MKHPYEEQDSENDRKSVECNTPRSSVGAGCEAGSPRATDPFAPPPLEPPLVFEEGLLVNVINLALYEEI